MGSPVRAYEYTRQIKSNFQRAALYALLVIAVMLLAHFRNIVCALLALMPVLVGMLWTVGAMALFGIPVPEDIGGAGLDTMSYAIAVEELAKVDGSLALILLAHTSCGLQSLIDFGTDDQKRERVPALAAGEALAALGYPGPMFSEGKGLTVAARREGEDWILDGSPLYVMSAGRCGLVLVPAVTAQ